MTSSSLFSTNDKIDYNSIRKKKDDKFYKNSITSFKAFDSVLFIKEFLGYEESQISEKSNKESQNKRNMSYNSKEKKISKNIQGTKISPTLEKCLTRELLNSITNDSNKNNKSQNQKVNNEKINNENNNESQLFLKITKKLFNSYNTPSQDKKKNNLGKINKKNSTQKKEKTLYEETVDGFEYQLKFIENSVHNILPKSYNQLSNKNHKKITSNIYLEKYNNNDNNFLYNNNENKNDINFPFFDDYYLSYDKRSALNIKKNILMDNNNKFNDKQNHRQIHKLKIIDNYEQKWLCNYCYCFNRGYRKACANCYKYRNINI